MKTGDYSDRLVILDNEHERVGKAPEQGAADIPVDHGKLKGSGAHALGYDVHCRTKTSAQSGSFILVPVLRVDQFGTGPG